MKITVAEQCLNTRPTVQVSARHCNNNVHSLICVVLNRDNIGVSILRLHGHTERWTQEQIQNIHKSGACHFKKYFRLIEN